MTVSTRSSCAARSVVRISEGRYHVELPTEPPPAALLEELAAASATLVSLNPIRDTLEDYFVRQVTSAEVLARDRGLGPVVADGGRE